MIKQKKNILRMGYQAKICILEHQGLRAYLIQL